MREILANEAYTGRWTFKKRNWLRDPTTRKRRYVRQVGGGVQEERPHLRIVPDDLWVAVEERKKLVAASYSGKPGAPGRRTAHLFAGLLFCGQCGAKMVDAGGGSPRYYRCAAAASGACTNKLPAREDKLMGATVQELRYRLFDTELGEKLGAKIQEQMKAFKVAAKDEARPSRRSWRSSTGRSPA